MNENDEGRIINDIGDPVTHDTLSHPSPPPSRLLKIYAVRKEIRLPFGARDRICMFVYFISFTLFMLHENPFRLPFAIVWEDNGKDERTTTKQYCFPAQQSTAGSIAVPHEF